MNIEELTNYLKKEIAYFKDLQLKGGITTEGKIRLDTFENVLEMIEGK